MNYAKPQDAPETTMAADGRTPLKRFRVEAVVFAPTRSSALARIGIGNGGLAYLDAARLVDEHARDIAAETLDLFDTLAAGGSMDELLPLIGRARALRERLEKK